MNKTTRDRLADALGGGERSNLPTASDVYGTPIVPPRRRSRQPELTDDSLQIGRFTVTTTHLAIPTDATQEEWADIGRTLLRLETAMQWCLGDWIVYGDARRWGATYEQIAAEFGFEAQTLRVYAMVARKVLVRNQQLSFSHHRLVAHLDQEQQQYWLGQAAGEGWSIGQMRDALKAQPVLPTPSPSPLADKRNKRAFNKVWRALQSGGAVDTDTLDHLQRWIDEVRATQGRR